MLRIYWKRPLTRLEIGLYATIVGILIAVFLERTLFYMELAERTAMQITVNNVNNALTMRRALDLLENRAENHALRPRNPFEVAGMRVTNRHPDISGSDKLAELDRGYWVYDVTAKELIYLPNLYRHLHTEAEGSTVRFRLAAGPDANYRLVPAAHYSW